MQAAQVHAAQTARVQGAPGETLAAPGGTMAAAIQLAIALLTAGLDSPELERGPQTSSLRPTSTAWQTSWPTCT